MTDATREVPMTPEPWEREPPAIDPDGDEINRENADWRRSRTMYDIFFPNSPHVEVDDLPHDPEPGLIAHERPLANGVRDNWFISNTAFRWEAVPPIAGVDALYRLLADRVTSPDVVEGLARDVAQPSEPPDPWDLLREVDGAMGKYLIPRPDNLLGRIKNALALVRDMPKDRKWIPREHLFVRSTGDVHVEMCNLQRNEIRSFVRALEHFSATGRLPWEKKP